MIIQVGNQRIERHASKKFFGILFGLFGNPAHLLSHQYIGPAVSRLDRFVSASTVSPLIIRERIYPLSVFVRSNRLMRRTSFADADDTALNDTKAASLSQFKHRALDAGVVPAVVRAIEFCDPGSVIVLYDSFWASAPHGGAYEHQVLYLCSFLGVYIVLSIKASAISCSFASSSVSLNLRRGAGGC
ncbi:hypothetical protein J2R76_003641 [Bradyrhizobium sp. USDA 4532]|nr:MULTISPECIES: hypothetical protein [unclassified Bradyrhizobium]MCP1835304.1 hypothetical protein [Bradyrhizobium sp. USDA 4545]MCP1920050.1 hypothetical protein [Bradyrhizobium sp. USDA 4532]